jgi:hypothetical protein
VPVAYGDISETLTSRASKIMSANSMTAAKPGMKTPRFCVRPCAMLKNLLVVTIEVPVPRSERTLDLLPEPLEEVLRIPDSCEAMADEQLGLDADEFEDKDDKSQQGQTRPKTERCGEKVAQSLGV